MSLQDKALQFRKAAQFAFKGNTTSLTNNQILAMATIYEPWSEKGVAYTVGAVVRVTENGKEVLYKCISAHTSQANWKPSQSTASLWQRIDAEHAGTKADPIPAAVNMVYYKDKYYLENGTTLYKCIRNSEIALQYLPSALVGNYFELVTS